jgi:hypothetical protein
MKKRTRASLLSFAYSRKKQQARRDLGGALAEARRRHQQRRDERELRLRRSADAVAKRVGPKEGKTVALQRAHQRSAGLDDASSLISARVLELYQT